MFRTSGYAREILDAQRPQVATARQVAEGPRLAPHQDSLSRMRLVSSILTDASAATDAAGTDVACFCGCAYTFAGDTGACPRCGEVCELRPGHG
jgi:hypothetical protein